MNAALFAVLMVTAAILYVGPLSALFGRRELIREVHVVAGLLLPLPVVAAVAGPWRRPVMADLRALNRFDAHDWRWLRSRGRDPNVRLGKFNPGQKLNAAFTAGAIAVLLATGSIMNWNRYFAVDWRTGATFVHDWLAIIVFIVVAGHVVMALSDRSSLRSMWNGRVPAAWARDRRSRWYQEMKRPPSRRPE